MRRRAAAHYGGMDAMAVIRSNTWGKPELPGCSVGCNVSHAGNQVWVAVWTTADLPFGKDYVGALAVEGRCDKVMALRLKVA